VHDTNQADLKICRSLLRGGSRTFLAASHLLPHRVRDRACALYAFCRVADDAVDLAPSGVGALDSVRARLERIYAGPAPDDAVDRALARVVHEVEIPRVLLDALLEGFDWDASGRRYRTLEELESYAARVAGSVGAMMALLMGVRAPELVARACDLGVAMQLSNIVRDVGEDARRGRIYLPLQWLEEAGVDIEAWLGAPRFEPALEQVARRLLGVAQCYYRQAELGIAALPRACRPGIRAAGRLYAEIGEQVARNGFDSVSRRAIVSPQRKLLVLAAGLAPHPRQGAKSVRDGAATRFLVEAVVAQAPPPTPLPAKVRAGSSAGAEDRWKSLIDLFTRLERRDAVHAARRVSSAGS
jgi:phytoene synthase